MTVKRGQGDAHKYHTIYGAESNFYFTISPQNTTKLRPLPLNAHVPDKSKGHGYIKQVNLNLKCTQNGFNRYHDCCMKSPTDKTLQVSVTQNTFIQHYFCSCVQFLPQEGRRAQLIRVFCTFEFRLIL